jgi:hypothetical protein
MNDCGASAEMPRYQCHKKVWALKIASIDWTPGEGGTITPVDAGYAPLKVSDDFMGKHSPRVGGYYVVYDDGYKSYSPEKAFEDGYTRL